MAYKANNNLLLEFLLFYISIIIYCCRNLNKFYRNVKQFNRKWENGKVFILHFRNIYVVYLYVDAGLLAEKFAAIT